MSKVEMVRGLNDSGAQLQVVEAVRLLQLSLASLSETTAVQIETLKSELSSQATEMVEAMAEDRSLRRRQVSGLIEAMEEQSKSLREDRSQAELLVSRLAAVIEPLVAETVTLNERIREQSETISSQSVMLAAMAARVEKLEASVAKVESALPKKGGKVLELASEASVVAVPGRVWETKPSWFKS